MRIGIISDLSNWRWAGCEELWASLAFDAVNAGHTVAVFLIRRNVPEDRLTALRNAGIQVHLPTGGQALADAVRTKVSWKLGSVLEPVFPLFADAAAFNPEVLLINLGDAVPTEVFLRPLERSGLLRCPYFVLCHNSAMFDQPVSRGLRDRVVRLYTGAQQTLFVAERTRMETEHLLAARLPKSAIVRNPVNLVDAGVVPMPVSSTVRLACLGRLATASKGQDLLLGALGSDIFRHRDWQLTIYGEGPDTEYLRLLAEHYGIAGRVSFGGYTDDIRAVWAKHHALVLPSRVESAPLVLVEAMLCGRTAIVTDVGGVTEWISEPSTGFVSSGISIESFCHALDRAWNARTNWTQIGRMARKQALDRVDTCPGVTLLRMMVGPLEATDTRSSLLTASIEDRLLV